MGMDASNGLVGGGWTCTKQETRVSRRISEANKERKEYVMTAHQMPSRMIPISITHLHSSRQCTDLRSASFRTAAARDLTALPGRDRVLVRGLKRWRGSSRKWFADDRPRADFRRRVIPGCAQTAGNRPRDCIRPYRF